METEEEYLKNTSNDKNAFWQEDVFFDYFNNYNIDNDSDIFNPYINLDYINTKILKTPNLLSINVYTSQDGSTFTKSSRITNILEDDINLNLINIEKMFIFKVLSSYREPICLIKNDNISDTIANKLKNLKYYNIDKIPFIFTPFGYKLNGYETIETEFLTDKIIFGFKTTEKESGFVLCLSKYVNLYNSNLNYNSHIKNLINDQYYYNIIDFGFFAEESYCVLKIK